MLEPADQSNSFLLGPCFWFDLMLRVGLSFCMGPWYDPLSGRTIINLLLNEDNTPPSRRSIVGPNEILP